MGKKSGKRKNVCKGKRLLQEEVKQLLKVHKRAQRGPICLTYDSNAKLLPISLPLENPACDVGPPTVVDKPLLVERDAIPSETKRTAPVPSSSDQKVSCWKLTASSTSEDLERFLNEPPPSPQTTRRRPAKIEYVDSDEEDSDSIPSGAQSPLGDVLVVHDTNVPRLVTPHITTNGLTVLDENWKPGTEGVFAEKCATVPARPLDSALRYSPEETASSSNASPPCDANEDTTPPRPLDNTNAETDGGISAANAELVSKPAETISTPDSFMRSHTELVEQPSSAQEDDLVATPDETTIPPESSSGDLNEDVEPLSPIPAEADEMYIVSSDQPVDTHESVTPPTSNHLRLANPNPHPTTTDPLLKSLPETPANVHLDPSLSRHDKPSPPTSISALTSRIQALSSQRHTYGPPTTTLVAGPSFWTDIISARRPHRRTDVRPWGPRHLEYDYQEARKEFQSQAYFALGKFGYLPPRGYSKNIITPMDALPSMGDLKRVPSFRMACERLDRADQALEEALANGETWDNTPVPAHYLQYSWDDVDFLWNPDAAGGSGSSETPLTAFNLHISSSSSVGGSGSRSSSSPSVARPERDTTNKSGNRNTVSSVLRRSGRTSSLKRSYDDVSDSFSFCSTLTPPPTRTCTPAASREHTPAPIPPSERKGRTSRKKAPVRAKGRAKG